MPIVPSQALNKYFSENITDIHFIFVDRSEIIVADKKLEVHIKKSNRITGIRDTLLYAKVF